MGEDLPKRASLPASLLCTQMEIEDLVSKATRVFFESMGVDTAFLEADPDDWEREVSFREGLCEGFWVIVGVEERTRSIGNNRVYFVRSD